MLFSYDRNFKCGSFSLIAMLAVYTIAACGKQKSQFAGSSSKLKVDNSKPLEAEQIPQPPVGTPDLSLPPEVQTPIIFEDKSSPTPTPEDRNVFSDVAPNFRTAVAPAGVWIPTLGNGVYYINLDKDRGYPVQHWDMQYTSNSGNRTYVTEIGLIIGKTNLVGDMGLHKGGTLGGIWRVSQDNTEKAIQVLDSATLGMAVSSRICVTSFSDPATGKKYIGAAYTATSGRKFIKIPIDKTKENKMDVTNLADKIYSVGNGDWWGYCCFMDQTAKRFWSKQWDSKIYGVNVLTGTALNTDNDNEAPPNKKFLAPKASYSDVSLNPSSSPLIIPQGSYDLLNGASLPSQQGPYGGVRGSYILSGTPKGNLVNSNKFLSSTYEQISDMIFAVSFDSRTLYVIKSDCFTPDIPCTKNTKYFEYPLNGIELKAISSLNDGRVVAVGAGTADVYLLSLKNKVSPSEGVNVVKIASLVGSPYMYTDFTGATLYSQIASNTFDFTAKAEFKVGTAVRNVQLLWNSDGENNAVPWQGLTLKYRCYAKAGNKPEWSIAANVAASGINFELANCNGAIDSVDIQAEGDGVSDTFSHTSNVITTVTQ